MNRFSEVLKKMVTVFEDCHLVALIVVVVVVVVVRVVLILVVNSEIVMFFIFGSCWPAAHEMRNPGNAKRKKLNSSRNSSQNPKPREKRDSHPFILQYTVNEIAVGWFTSSHFLAFLRLYDTFAYTRTHCSPLTQTPVHQKE